MLEIEKFMKEETERELPSLTEVIDEAIRKRSPVRKNVFNPETTPLL
jgi:predicted house-cleaning noncanonical NTP pyrophosphatase (MazG superfamily)